MICDQPPSHDAEQSRAKLSPLWAMRLWSVPKEWVLSPSMSGCEKIIAQVAQVRRTNCNLSDGSHRTSFGLIRSTSSKAPNSYQQKNIITINNNDNSKSTFTLYHSAPLSLTPCEGSLPGRPVGSKHRALALGAGRRDRPEGVLQAARLLPGSKTQRAEHVDKSTNNRKPTNGTKGIATNGAKGRYERSSWHRY